MSHIDYFNVHDLKDDLKEHAIRSGGITLFSRLLDFMIQMVTTMVLARILLPEEFGLMAMVIALSGFLIIFIDLGLTDATIQTSEINHHQISALFWINVIVTGAIVLMVMVLSPLAAWFYSEPRLTHVMMLYSTYLFVAALSTQHIALLKRRMLFFKISVIEITAGLVSNALAVLLALHGWSYWSLAVREVALRICMTLGAWISCRWSPGLPSFRHDIRSLLNFGRDTTGGFLINYFGRNFDKILIGWRYGAGSLGYYSRAYSLFALPTTNSSEALKNVATSTLSKLRNEPIRYRKYYFKALSLMSFLGMPISFFFMIESEDLVLLLFGPQWKQTVDIFRIMAAGTGVWIIYSTRYWLHISLGRPDRLLRWYLFDFLISIVVIFLGLRFGTNGVALACTCTLYVLTGLGLKYAGKPIGIKFRGILSATWKYLVAAVFAGLLCWQILPLVATPWSRLVRLIVSFFLYTSLYLGFVVVLYRNVEPINDFFSVFRTILPKSLLLRFKILKPFNYTE